MSGFRQGNASVGGMQGNKSKPKQQPRVSAASQQARALGGGSSPMWQRVLGFFHPCPLFKAKLNFQISPCEQRLYSPRGLLLQRLQRDHSQGHEALYGRESPAKLPPGVSSSSPWTPQPAGSSASERLVLETKQSIQMNMKMKRVGLFPALGCLLFMSPRTARLGW